MRMRMTTAALDRGFKNALICGGYITASWIVLAFAISLVSGRNLGDSFSTSIGILLILILIAYFSIWLYQINRSGAVLLDCGPAPGRLIFLICAGFSAYNGIGGTYESHSGIIGGFPGGGNAFWLTASAFYASMAFGRFQIRENGIWQFSGLVRWDQIESYRWEGKTDSTLMIHAKTRFPFLGRGALPVPIEHKDAVDELIKKYRTVEK